MPDDGQSLKYSFRRWLMLNVVVDAGLVALTVMWHLLMAESRVLDLPAVLLAGGFFLVSTFDWITRVSARK